MDTAAVQGKWTWVAGPVTVALGLTAHLVSCGSAPAVPVVLAFAALCGLAALLIARWVHGPLMLLLLCGVVQQVLHLGFDAFGGSIPGNGLLEHVHGGSAQVPAVPDGAGHGAGAGPGTAGPGAAHSADVMLFTHAAAAILTLLAAAGVAKLEQLRATARGRGTS